MIAAVTGGVGLLKAVLSALVASVGVTGAFSLAVLGTSRYGDARRASQNGVATVYWLLSVLALTACGGAVVYGIVLIAKK